MDDAGTSTLLSPHPRTAPDSLYDHGPGNDGINVTINFYRGELRWSAYERAARLSAMLDVERARLSERDRIVEITETFDEYNNRIGLAGDRRLQARSFDDEESTYAAEALAAQKAWESELDSYIEHQKRQRSRSGWLRTRPGSIPQRPNEHRARTRPAGV